MSEIERIHAEAARLFQETNGDPEALATVAAQYKLAAQERSGGAITVIGIVASRTGEPRVQMEWGENAAQLSVEQARAHALLILEAAQNAITDASLVEWGTSDVGMDRDKAAHLLDMLRRYRRDRWGQPDLDVEFEQPAPDEPTA